MSNSSSQPSAPAGPVPARPGRIEEVLGRAFLLSFGPKLRRIAPSPPPENLAPFEPFAIPRSERGGALSATWFPAPGPPRGAVLLAHPWVEWGQTYFHRRGRIEALRAVGYHVLTFDLSGFGGSPSPSSLWDRDLEDALAALRSRAPGLPLGFWGVSSGGYWGHVLMSRHRPFRAAVFEDVSPHLLEWSWHTVPLGRPVYLLFRALLRRAHSYLDLRRHAPHLGLDAVAYVGGGSDRGIPFAAHRSLAERAGGDLLLVRDAGHLAAIKLANAEVLALALRTLEKGMGAGPKIRTPIDA